MLKPTEKQKSVVPVQSIEELFRLYADRIFNFCRRYTGHLATAEDITQEVFVRAIRYQDSFEGHSKPSTWLYAIALNLCKDHFAKKERLKLVSDESLIDLAERQDHGSQTDIGNEDLKERVQKAILQLNERQREILILSRYHGKSYAEISEITGLSIGAIKVKMFRSLERLKVLLEQTGEAS